MCQCARKTDLQWEEDFTLKVHAYKKKLGVNFIENMKKIFFYSTNILSKVKNLKQNKEEKKIETKQSIAIKNWRYEKKLNFKNTRRDLNANYLFNISTKAGKQMETIATIRNEIEEKQ